MARIGNPLVRESQHQRSDEPFSVGEVDGAVVIAEAILGITR